MKTQHRLLAAASAASLCLAGLASVPTPAQAVSADLVISEVYGGGGNTGANLNADYVELTNRGAQPVDLAGLSLQYRSATGTAAAHGVAALSGSVPAGKSFLIRTSGHGSNGSAIPEADLAVTGVNMAAANGVVWLARGTTAQTLPTGHLAPRADVVDLVGFGSANTYEGAATAPLSVTTSASRLGADSDSNAADFAVGSQTPEPCDCDGTEEPGDPEEPAVPQRTIAEIQGTGATSPLVGQTVTTRGVVTARYATGGFRGFVIQTPGAQPGAASHGIFVYGSRATAAVGKGEYVEVTGEVSEYHGLTEITPGGADDVRLLPDTAQVQPAAVPWPATDAARESLESMLVLPSGPFTVTDNYDLNAYGEIMLAADDEPLRQPTDVGRPGSATALAQAAHNEAVKVTLDDGASRNYMTNDAAKDVPLPYLTDDRTIQVGNGVRFHRPVVVDFRYDLWRLQPTGDLTGGDPEGVLPVTFLGDTRTDAPESVGGDLQVASFNVLNYFTTTGDELDGCRFYTDRTGDPVAVRGGCDARGAAEQEDLERQQGKIVAAINALGAEVVSLEEIENSAFFGQHRDAALGELVQALNADLGREEWAFVPSPEDGPAVADEDVIRTAFIYQRSAVMPVWDSVIHNAPEFDRARDPLAQVFQPKGGSAHDRFILIVNHFKSKGSPPAPGTDPANEDSGQGNWNALRTSQARSLVRFADGLKQETGVRKVLLDGDFNSYGFEDPLEVLREAGYVSLEQAFDAGSTYVYDGMVGSLDHAFANRAALGSVSGADVWNINAVEPVALEYSRHNYNVTNFFEARSPYRSSDHDPIVFGLDVQRRP